MTIGDRIRMARQHAGFTQEDLAKVAGTSKQTICPQSKKAPLLGESACGEPIYANQDFESYVEVSTDVRADFAHRCRGDSIINARIFDGDIVLIRKQDIVNDGEIAAVIIENEATLKRFIYHEDSNCVDLCAENPTVKPLIYTHKKLDQIHILGKAIVFQSDVR